MAQEENKENKINVLYEDETCQVTDLYIKIYKYFFPLPTSRTIMFTDIDQITLESTMDVTTPWGPSSHHLNNWFHLDANRDKKPYFIAIHEKGERVIPSLTPDNAMKVFELLRNHFIELGRKHPAMV